MGRKTGAVQPASDFIAQLCQDPQQIEQLRQFIQRRLFNHRRNPGTGRIFFLTDTDDILHSAIGQVLMGEENSKTGRHLRSRSLRNGDSFLKALRSAFNSVIFNLATKRDAHLSLDDPGRPESTLLAPPDPILENLSRRDLEKILFARLHSRARGKPALLAVIRAWKREFLSSDRIPDPRRDRTAVFRVRAMARQILQELGEPGV